MTRLQGQVAVVTGASGGIGVAICRALAGEGAAVIVTYNRDRAQACALAESLESGPHLVVQAAVDDTDSLIKLALTVGAHHGRVDLLVNCAGVTRYVAHDDLDGLDDETFDRIFRVNVRGAYATIRALRNLLGASDNALVVNISSIAGSTGNGSNVAYCASKAALDSITRSLAVALAPAVRLVSVAPGLVEGRYSRALDPQWSERQRVATPLQRLAVADDVARAVVALATELTFTTGCVVPVDGGRALA